MTKVFIVEDDAVMQSFMKEVLKEEGYEIVGIYDTGEDAILAIANSQPDIVLMDIELAGYLDGVETAERIRDSYKCPIIFMSGLSDSHTLERTKFKETFAYLIKPFKPRELFINIEMALYKYHIDQELKSKQQLLATTLKSLGEGLIVTDKTGIVKIINPIAEHLLKINASNSIDKDLNEFFKISDIQTQQFLKVLKDLSKWPLKYNQIYEVNTELIVNEEEKIPIYLCLNYFNDKNEEINGYVLVFRDLSQQKKNQSLIEKLSVAIRNNPVGVMMLDNTARIDYINPKFTEITGFYEADLLGKNIDVIFEDLQDRGIIDVIKEKINAGVEWKSEIKAYRKGAGEFWEYVILAPIHGENENINSFIFIIEDISQSKQYSEQVELSEKKYKDLFEHSPVALWYVNFQEVYNYLLKLKEIGVTDIYEYFELNPEHLNDCISKIELLDVNMSALELVEWKDKIDLNERFIKLFSNQNNDFFLDLFNSIYHRQVYKQEELNILINETQLKTLQIRWLISLDSFSEFKNVLISTIDITEKIVTNDILKKQAHDLKERVKEQTALYRIYTLLNQSEMQQNELMSLIVTEMISAFQQPGNTSIEIKLFDDIYHSPFYKVSDKVYSSDIYFKNAVIGRVSVYIVNTLDDVDFLPEEINLISIIAKQISNYLDFNHQSIIIDKKLKMERTISSISTRFFSTADFEENIQSSLAEIGTVAQCDRTYIFTYSDDHKLMSNEFEWCNNGVDPQIDILQDIPIEAVPWIHACLTKCDLIIIDDVDIMPIEAKAEQELLKAQNIKSLIIIPFLVKDKIKGFVGFDNVKKTNAWDENDQTLLKLFTQLLGNSWERKITSELLMFEHNFTNQIINSVSVLIMVIKPNGNIVHFNRFCEVLSGYKKSEMKNLSSLRKLHLPEEEENFNNYINNLLNGYEQDSQEIIWMSRDKKIKIIQWDSKIIYYQGVLDYIVLNGTDITDIKRSEQLLIEKEVQYRTLVQNLTIGIFRSTGYDSGRFIQANKALSDMLGYDNLDELFTLNESDIYANPNERVEILKNAIKTGEIQKKEILLKKKNGTPMWAILNAKTIYDDYGNFKWIDAFIEDITEIRKLEQQLVQSQKMEAIGQLAAGIAHEINTPTQFVSDNLLFLKGSFVSMYDLLGKITDLLTSVSDKKILEEITGFKKEIDYDFILEEIPLAIQQSQDGLSRISTIIMAMKDFSHPANEDLKTMEINHMLNSTLTVARNEWKYNCELVTDFDPDNPTIQCFPGELNQAFLNIIVNAAHAIKEKVGNSGVMGKITVKTKKMSDYVEISISDTGVGILPENKDKLYNPFFTTKEPGKGTGQGLSIVHHSIVEKHRGTIDFESIVGEGTTFTLRLPL